MAKKSQLFIPVVTGPKEARTARLWEVGCRYASLSETAAMWMLDDKKIEPTLHHLGKLNRYKSGMNGLGAVRRLLRDADQAASAPDDLEDALRSRRLVSAEGAADIGVIEEHSTDLGLGLALLLDLVPAKLKVLAATGGLGHAEDAKADNDLPVTPVNDVPAKLQAMLEKKRSDGVLRELSLVFTPRHYYTENRELALVAQLPMVEALEQAGVAVHPVDSFAAAAKILGIDPDAHAKLRQELLSREIRRRRLRLAAFILPTLALSALLGNLALFLNQPITLEWQPMTRDAPHAEPYQLCFDAQGRADSQRAFAKTGAAAIPAVPAAARLAWEVRTGGVDEAKSWQNRLLGWLGYRGYPLAVVLVGKDSGITDNAVFIPRQTSSGDAPARSAAGTVWSYSLALDGKPEESRLLVLANRLMPFDSEALKIELKRQFPARDGGVDLPAVENYLKEHSRALLPFPFQASLTADACPTRP